MGWFRDFLLFFADMFRQWVGRLTGALSLILGVSPLVFPAFFSGDRGLIHTQWAWWIASALAFLVAAYSAWREEHKKRIAAEQKHEDNKPLLGLETHSVEGPKTWTEHPVPVTFTIQHIGGRVPTAIRFDPIPSKHEKYSLVFNPLPFANRPPHPTGMSFEVLEVGVPSLNAVDREKTRDTQKKLFDLFLDDGPKGLLKIEYPLISQFMDGDEPCSQAFCLRFEMDRIRFSPDTTPCTKISS
jgi:hypothetical protein